ncbi:hypothetical protein M5W70_19730, partial [Paenibacillus larvae]|uniref:hypothetical protein n=1 Tax=Paenibacillus larvae TaxID=1464 RepID=UPI00227EB90A
FCQLGMFIHCHPHLSILDLFLIRQMVPFSLPRFAKNIDSTYIARKISKYLESSAKKLSVSRKSVIGAKPLPEQLKEEK